MTRILNFYRRHKADCIALAIILPIVSLLMCAAAHAQMAPSTTPFFDANGINFPVQNPPSPVPWGSVTRTGGNPGNRLLSYWIVTNTAAGASNPAGPFYITNAADTLGNGNTNTIAWPAVVGATSYDVLRSSTTPTGACNCAVAKAVTSTSTTDSSETLQSYTVTPVNLQNLNASIVQRATTPSAHTLYCQRPGMSDVDMCAGAAAAQGGTGNGGTGALTTQITPTACSAGQNYAYLWPTTFSQYTINDAPTLYGYTKAAASSAYILRTRGSGLGDWDVWTNHGGFSLPSYVPAASVQAVYGIGVSLANFGAGGVSGIYEMAFGQGTPGFNAIIQFSGSAWPGSPNLFPNIGTGQGTVTLATGAAAQTFNFANTSASIDIVSSSGGDRNDQLNVSAVAIQVCYTSTDPQVPQNLGIQVAPPLFYDIATNTLGCNPASPFAAGCISAANAAKLAALGTTASSVLGANVSMPSANTAYDGPNVNLAAGTWFLRSTVTLDSGANNARYTCKIWDGGSTVVASTGQDNSGSTTTSITLEGFATPGGTANYKVTCYNTSTGATILAAAPNNGAGNNATQLNAVRLQ